MKLFDSIAGIRNDFLNNPYFEMDNDGQLVIYTGLYEHSDGSIHDKPKKLETKGTK